MMKMTAMKKHSVCLSVLLLAGVLPSRAADTEENALLVPIQKFFDGIAHRDAAEMKASAIPGAIMLFMRDSGPSQSPIEQFAERVGRPGPRLEESIHDAVIRIDNDLAFIWAPSVFKIDGNVDHCATDLFTLVQKDGRWLIASLSNTRKSCS